MIYFLKMMKELNFGDYVWICGMSFRFVAFTANRQSVWVLNSKNVLKHFPVESLFSHFPVSSVNSPLLPFREVL